MNSPGYFARSSSAPKYTPLSASSAGASSAAVTITLHISVNGGKPVALRSAISFLKNPA